MCIVQDQSLIKDELISKLENYILNSDEFGFNVSLEENMKGG